MVHHPIDRRPTSRRILHPETFFQTIPGSRRVFAVRGLEAILAAVPVQYEGCVARRRNGRPFFPKPTLLPLPAMAGRRTISKRRRLLLSANRVRRMFTGEVA